MFVVSCCLALLGSAHGLVLQPSVHARAPASFRAAPATTMQFFGGGGGGGQSARDKDFERRQDRLQARKGAAAAAPKGQVTVTFPQKGNKKVVCQQGTPIGTVAQKAGVRIKFDCKNGRCGTCTVRLNGRAAAKICQGAKIPGGATKSLSITLDNP